MRFIVMIKATQDSEAGVMPTEAEFAEMTRFNEELVKAGVMENGEGLHPSARGARVHFDGADRRVEAGPFPIEQLVAGFWTWRCASLDEAIDWARRCPNPMRGPSTIEIRRIYGAEDFGEAYTPELQAKEEQMRKDIEAQQQQRGGGTPG